MIKEINVLSCARCGGNHGNLKFIKLVNPDEFTHYGICPKTKDPILLAETSPYYFIWSHEHSRWWKPNHGGYTENIYKAGIYSDQESRDILFGANINADHKKVPNEIRVTCNDRAFYGIKEPVSMTDQEIIKAEDFLDKLHPPVEGDNDS